MADFRINIADSSVRYGRNTGATRGLTDMDLALTDRQARFRHAEHAAPRPQQQQH
jgi:hypothetical protein